VDYAYTLQGWLKGMNADSLSSLNDMGRDGTAISGKRFQPRDVLGYTIHYFTGDYASIGIGTRFDQDALTTTAQYKAASKDLFNGNIKSISQHNRILADGKPIAYAYGYDQLHRLAKMDAWKATATQTLWQTTAASADYQERVSYDANGNILKYKRNKDAGVTQDSLNYKYNAGTNQLQYITDNVLNTVSTTDIDNQSPNNYIYDKSGNMVADNSQSMAVSWSPYGKILTNTKIGGASLAFGYNAMQQRVVKRVAQNGDTTRTYYIRDAQGNTMGVYTRHNDSVSWREQYIFGSSRLGMYRADTLVNKGLLSINKFYEGKRNYELTNHLGNVMAVINDRKADTIIGVNKGYNAVVISAVDYYPFGMSIDSRTYTSALYRYGFNGKETDKETSEQDYGMRIYDPRNPTFLSIDPIAKKYPNLSPYQFASDNPIWGKDINGLELITPFFSTSAIEILPDLIQSDITLEQGWITHPTTIPIFYNESQQTPLSPYKAAESSNPKPEPLLKRENRNNKNKRDDETFELYITIRDNKQTKGTTNQPLVYIGHKLIAKGYRRYGTEEIQEKNYEPILQGSYDAVTGAEQLLIELNNRGRTDNLKTSVLLDNDKNAIDPKRKPTQYLERTLKGRILLEINNPKWRTDYKRSPKVIREKLKPSRA
jgi:RHS repeat-associated protein